MKGFTKATALSKVGKQVRLLVPWSGFPLGTRGVVVDAVQHGRRWLVEIAWNVPPPRPVFLKPGVQTLGMTQKLTDRFTKQQYEHYFLKEPEL
jgi:hypothetical protein